MNITRRAALGGIFALPATAGVVGAAGAAELMRQDSALLRYAAREGVNHHDFELVRLLRDAKAADLIHYHAAALADALSGEHGGRWRVRRVRDGDDRTFCMMLMQEKLA